MRIAVVSFAHIDCIRPILDVIEILAKYTDCEEIDYYYGGSSLDLKMDPKINIIHYNSLIESFESIQSSIIAFGPEIKYVLDQIGDAMLEREYDAIIYDEQCIWARIISIKSSVPSLAYSTSFLSQPPSHVTTSLTIKLEAMEDSIKYLQSLDIPPSIYEIDVETESILLKFIYYIEEFLSKLEKYSSNSNPFSLLPHNNEPKILLSPQYLQIFTETDPKIYKLTGSGIYYDDASAILPKKERTRRLFIAMDLKAEKSEFIYETVNILTNSSDYNIILADPANITDNTILNKNTQMHQSINYLDAIRQSDIVITDCSMSSALECIFSGVPMICLPKTPEQQFISQRLETLGVSKELTRDDFKNRQYMSTLLNQLSTDADVKSNLLRLRNSMLHLGGAKAVAEIVYEFASHKDLKSALNYN